VKANLKGKFLISNPELKDPNFNGSVVLVVEHDEKGAMGFILNRPMDLLEEPSKKRFFIFEGGPVGQDSFWILANHRKSNFKKIKTGLYYGELEEWANYVETAVELDFSKKNLKAKCFAGYASWVKNQLETEIDSEAWIVAETDLREVFSLDDVDMWVRTISKKDSNFKWTRSFIGDPDRN